MLRGCRLLCRARGCLEGDIYRKEVEVYLFIAQIIVLVEVCVDVVKTWLVEDTGKIKEKKVT